MNAPATNLHRIKTYTSKKVARHYMLIGLALIAAGTLGVAAYDPSDRKWTIGAALVIAGVIWCLACHFWLLNPGKPLVELSPEGITLRTAAKAFIPWREVRGVDAIDFTTWVRGVPVTFRNVTAVLVSRSFYEEYIEAHGPLMAGRGWANTFIAKGDAIMQVLIHHDILPVTPEELRREIAARWYAFRDTERPPDTARAATAPADATSHGGEKTAQPRSRNPVRFIVRWGKKPVG